MKLSRKEIEELLPHRDLWLLVDSVLLLEESKIITSSLFSQSSAIIENHMIANNPRIIPGVLLIEFVAQSAHLQSLLLSEKNSASNMDINTTPVLARSKARFLAPVFAGDEVISKTIAEEKIRGVSVHQASLSVKNQEVCRVQIIGTPIEKI